MKITYRGAVLYSLLFACSSSRFNSISASYRYSGVPVEHPRSRQTTKNTAQHQGKSILFTKHSNLSSEIKPLHSHTNLSESDLCNTIPLTKQGSRPGYLIVSLGRLCWLTLISCPAHFLRGMVPTSSLAFVLVLRLPSDINL